MCCFEKCASAICIRRRLSSPFLHPLFLPNGEMQSKCCRALSPAGSRSLQQEVPRNGSHYQLCFHSFPFQIINIVCCINYQVEKLTPAATYLGTMSKWRSPTCLKSTIAFATDMLSNTV